MRVVLVQTLQELARKDPKIVVLTGDLGYTVLEPFAEEFPDRFYNVGVAEQNMVGIATGLAEAGWIPFVYSIVTFASLRAYEFIRNGPVWHNLPVRILSVGGGLEYGTLGLTHYGLEDIGVMRLQPNMTVLAPADNLQLKTMLKKTWDLPGPVYYRISKYDLEVPNLRGRFGLGRLQIIRRGRDMLVLTMGNLTTRSSQVADNLAKEKINCTVGIISSVNPLPVKQLKQLLSEFKVVVTVEAHYQTGGIGSAMAEVIADNGLRCKLVKFGVNQPMDYIGSEDYLYQQYGLSVKSMISRIKSLCKTQRE